MGLNGSRKIRLPSISTWAWEDLGMGKNFLKMTAMRVSYIPCRSIHAFSYPHQVRRSTTLNLIESKKSNFLAKKRAVILRIDMFSTSLLL